MNLENVFLEMPFHSLAWNSTTSLENLVLRSFFRAIYFPYSVSCWGYYEDLQSGLGFPGNLVKNFPAMQETPVLFLGREDLLEKG